MGEFEDNVGAYDDFGEMEMVFNQKKSTQDEKSFSQFSSYSQNSGEVLDNKRKRCPRNCGGYMVLRRGAYQCQNPECKYTEKLEFENSEANLTQSQHEKSQKDILIESIEKYYRNPIKRRLKGSKTVLLIQAKVVSQKFNFDFQTEKEFLEICKKYHKNMKNYFLEEFSPKIRNNRNLQTKILETKNYYFSKTFPTWITIPILYISVNQLIQSKSKSTILSRKAIFLFDLVYLVKNKGIPYEYEWENFNNEIISEFLNHKSLFEDVDNLKCNVDSIPNDVQKIWKTFLIIFQVSFEEIFPNLFKNPNNFISFFFEEILNRLIPLSSSNNNKFYPFLITNFKFLLEKTEQSYYDNFFPFLNPLIDEFDGNKSLNSLLFEVSVIPRIIFSFCLIYNFDDLENSKMESFLIFKFFMNIIEKSHFFDSGMFKIGENKVLEMPKILESEFMEQKHLKFVDNDIKSISHFSLLNLSIFQNQKCVSAPFIPSYSARKQHVALSTKINMTYLRKLSKNAKEILFESKKLKKKDGHEEEGEFEEENDYFFTIKKFNNNKKNFEEEEMWREWMKEKYENIIKDTNMIIDNVPTKDYFNLKNKNIKNELFRDFLKRILSITGIETFSNVETQTQIYQIHSKIRKLFSSFEHFIKKSKKNEEDKVEKNKN